MTRTFVTFLLASQFLTCAPQRSPDAANLVGAPERSNPNSTASPASEPPSEAGPASSPDGGAEAVDASSSTALTPAAPSETFSGWNPQQATTLRAAVSAAHEIIESPIFREVVTARGDIHESPRGPAVAGSELLTLLSSRLPVEYVRAANSGGETADTCASGRVAAVTNLGEGNLHRWPAGSSRADLLRKACLINTIVHEWTHAIPGSGPCGERFIDKGHKHSSVPLVPYAVGSMAQCAFLEKAGVVEHAKLSSCIDAVGTKVFNGLSVCEKDGWLTHLTASTAPDAGAVH